VVVAPARDAVPGSRQGADHKDGLAQIANRADAHFIDAHFIIERHREHRLDVVVAGNCGTCSRNDVCSGSSWGFGDRKG